MRHWGREAFLVGGFEKFYAEASTPLEGKDGCSNSNPALLIIAENILFFI